MSRVKNEKVMIDSTLCMDDRNTDWTSPDHARMYRTSTAYYNIVGKPLSDRRIAMYQNKGWYKAENKAARKARAEKRNRRSNFSEGPDGRLIYNPW